MKILGIESSSICASCAVFNDDRMMVEYSQCHKKAHSERLMPMVIKVLEDADLKIGDIDYIAVSKGPGSYTGLRIGASIAKGLSFAKDIQIVAPKSLEVLATNVAVSERLVVAVIDANRGRCYGGIYKFTRGNLEVILEQNAYDIPDFIEKINELGQEVLLVGDCAHNSGDIFRENMKVDYKIASYSDSILKASSVCNRAIKLIEDGVLEDNRKYAPSYLRPSQAERQRDERRKS